MSGCRGRTVRSLTACRPRRPHAAPFSRACHRPDRTRTAAPPLRMCCPADQLAWNLRPERAPAYTGGDRYGYLFNPRT
ncbi:hypothetical protein GCM10010518_16860 [Kitasatospora cinereorecta]